MQEFQDKFIDSLVAEEKIMFQYHKKTIETWIEKMEKGIYSSIIGLNDEKIVSPATLTDEKRLNKRVDFFKLCMDAIDFEEEYQEANKDSSKEVDYVEKNFARLKKDLSLLMFHRETLKALIVKKKNTLPLDLSESLETEEKLQERYDYYYLRKEAVDVQIEIEAKQALTESYIEHVDRTLEERRPVSDQEIRLAIMRMMELPIKGKMKKDVIDTKSRFDAGKIVGADNRRAYLKSIENFIKQNS